LNFREPKSPSRSLKKVKARENMEDIVMASLPDDPPVTLHLTLIVSMSVMREHLRESDFDREIREAKEYMWALERLRPNRGST
jgi:hypothetical protein